MNCPLCLSHNTHFFQQTFHTCDDCHGIFRDKQHYISPNEEKKRYEEHHNDVNDTGYQHFVSPITQYVQEHFSDKHQGLDFGSGTGPVISKILLDNDYVIEQYDPFFNNQPHLLSKRYDYIVSCEVIEHFKNPRKEFSRLKNMLHPGGELVCMTHLYHSDIYFPNWYYKNDRTHVFIYRHETIQWIANHFEFSDYKVDNRLIVFKK